MAATSYTHRDLSTLLGVSETTIKSYRSKFPAFLPVARQGKPVRLHQEALEVCRRIRDLFADGLSIAQTTQELRAEFKEYPSDRRLSIRNTPAAGQGAAAGELSIRLAQLAQAQEQARERMALLEAEVRNLATLEAASKALVAELLTELRAARAGGSAEPAGPAAPAALSPPVTGPARPAPAGMPAAEAAPARPVGGLGNGAAQPSRRNGYEAGPVAGGVVGGVAAATAGSGGAGGPGGPAAEAEPTVLTARKIVTVHGRGGTVASYALDREPRPEPLFPEPERPEAAFLDLPAVIRSDRGDFLGLPGGQNVRRLVEALTPEGGDPASWFREGPEAWACSIPLGRAQVRELVFERTTTPRGNLVGLIRHMRLNETEATPVQLQEIFRQLRDQMA